MSAGPFSESTQGKPITVTSVSPAVTAIHEMNYKQYVANIHECTVTLSNPGAADIITEVHYNNGLIQITVPAHDTRTIGITIEGDSVSCFVSSPVLRVTHAVGESGTIYVGGGWSDE